MAVNKNAILNLHEVVTSAKTKFPEIVFEVASWHGMSMPDQVRVTVFAEYVRRMVPNLCVYVCMYALLLDNAQKYFITCALKVLNTFP